MSEAAGEHRERDAPFTTSWGTPIPRVYDARDLPPALDERLGAPGASPFTRGVHPTMYRGRLWTMRQYAGFGSAKETNKRYRYLLDHGQTGLSVAFDLPTQMGYDPDAPMARACSAVLTPNPTQTGSFVCSLIRRTAEPISEGSGKADPVMPFIDT